MRGVCLTKWSVSLVILVVPMVMAADVVTEWNEKALACATAAKQLPFVATRTMAMVHTAMFDAVNSVEGHYAPYRIKEVAAAESSPQAAGVANQALSRPESCSRCRLRRVSGSDCRRQRQGWRNRCRVKSGAQDSGSPRRRRGRCSEHLQTRNDSWSLCRDHAPRGFAMGRSHTMGHGTRVTVSAGSAAAVGESRNKSRPPVSKRNGPN